MNRPEFQMLDHMVGLHKSSNIISLPLRDKVTLAVQTYLEAISPYVNHVDVLTHFKVKNKPISYSDLQSFLEARDYADVVGVAIYYYLSDNPDKAVTSPRGAEFTVSGTQQRVCKIDGRQIKREKWIQFAGEEFAKDLRKAEAPEWLAHTWEKFNVKY